MSQIALHWMQRVVIAATLGSLLGCASLRNGGTPESLPRRAQDRVAVDGVLNEAGNLDQLLVAQLDAPKRNEFIRARLLSIDARYFDFVTNLRVERQAADAGVQLAQIALGVVGVSTSATRTKTNLAAAAATLAGVKAVVDKEYYFDKSVPGLVAIMNAKRLAVLTSIRRSMILAVESYGPQDVLADLDRYERMGQLGEAVAAVEVFAKELESVNLQTVKTIGPVTDAEVEVTRKVNLALGRLETLEKLDADGKNRAKLEAAIVALGGKPDLSRSYKKAALDAGEAFQTATPKQISAALIELEKP